MRFKNYKNKHTNDNVIHSYENLMGMTFDEITDRANELGTQYKQIGLPTNSELNSSPNAVFVNAYTKDDGTQVRAHWRGVNGSNNSIAGQIQNGVSIPNYKDGIEGNGTKNIDIQTALAPLLAPLILSQLAMQQNLQSQQNIPTGFAANVDTNNINIFDENIYSDYIGNKSSTTTKPEIPIYPENGVIKGGISNDYNQNNNDKTIGDKFKEWLFTNVVTEKISPMASHSVKDGLNDMEAAKQNPNATVYNSINDLNDSKLQDKCKSLGIPTDSKGAIFDINSYESKKIADAPEIDNYIKNMVENDGKPNDNKNIHLGVFNSKPWQLKGNLDRQAALQNVTIYEPEITEDGKFKCKIIDYSDFKPSKYGDLKFANDWGYKMQEEGYYKNYYQIYEIEKDIPKRYLKK